MRHSLLSSPNASICHICAGIRSHNARTPALFVASLQVANRGPNIALRHPSKPVAASLYSTSSPLSRAHKTRTAVSEARDGRTSNAPVQQQQQQQQKGTQLTDLADVVAAVDRVTKAFLGQQGVPSEQTTLAALQACAQNDVKILLDAESQAEAGDVREGHQPPETAVSHLLDLDRNGKSGRKTAAAAAAVAATTRAARKPQRSSAPQLQDVVDKISEAAYAIISHPTVVITPDVLERYVDVQARLGKPESLPYVFDLFATKPRPRAASGSIAYTRPNPDRVGGAIPTDVAERALDAAVEAKNLGAAIGIVESAYGTKAFVRAKIVRKALIPAVFFGVAPAAAYLVASRLSLLQNTMDPGAATGVAFAGILTYVGFTLSIGLVASATANDQMRRVSWTPGTPLRQRWLREEERAAFDRVACSFGFSEEQRYGEEEGNDFQALRQYVLQKGMILDAVELMEGMS